MEEAPSSVDVVQLNDLHIEIHKEFNLMALKKKGYSIV
jgi:hypothetical protein